MRWLVLALLCGCSNSEDLCSDPQLMGLTCMTIKVVGSIDGDTLDDMIVDSTYSPNASVDAKAATHRTPLPIRVDQPDLGFAKLPVSFPEVFLNPSATFTDTNSRIVIVARWQGAAVGIGQVFFGDQFSGNAVASKSHTHQTLDLTKASSSLCFDGVKSGPPMETDVDCGGRLCLACGPGKQCEADSDCVFPLTCQFLDSSTNPPSPTGSSGNFCE
jgi:hypothetical protein